MPTFIRRFLTWILWCRCTRCEGQGELDDGVYVGRPVIFWCDACGGTGLEPRSWAVAFVNPKTEIWDMREKSACMFPKRLGNEDLD